MHKKNFNSPDKILAPSTKTEVKVVEIGDSELHRMTFQPGWKWSIDIKPLAKTASCQMHHLLFGISGHLHSVMEDGTELDMRSGDVLDIPPGHDGWVVGPEPFVCLDLAGVKVPK